MRHVASRRGFGLVEVVVVLVIVALVGLLIVAALPRQREKGRLLACQVNLMQIGKALVLYTQPSGTLPAVPEMGRGEAARAPSPLGALIQELGLDDFSVLGAETKLPTRGSIGPPRARVVPGFVCPSDLLATTAVFPAPVSYRATAGDTTDGKTGAFAPGRLLRLGDVESADGNAYTAAFSERLVGTNRDELDLRNYGLVPGPINARSCGPYGNTVCRGDAGSSWAEPDWRSTLYNHAMTPNQSVSCIATDGRSALMGASSGHTERVHVLMLDGSVRALTPRVDPKIWRGLANTDDGAATTAKPSAVRSRGGP